jgi:hypothetical protein
MKRLVIAFAATFSILGSARANLFFEPYFGQTWGSLKSTSASSGNVSESENSNAAVGARLAWQLDVAYFGLDAMTTLGAQTKRVDTGNRTDWQASTAWIFGGARLEKLRVFAGYGVLNTGDSKSPTTTTALKGDSMKFGVGYTDLPITINLEYWINDYKKFQIGSGSENDIPGPLLGKVSNDLFFLSVSIPMEF